MDERVESAGAAPELEQFLAGRYRILQKLGEGAMGAVYLGEHLRIGRRDAIKVLRPGMARDPEAIARFTRGARNVSAVRHPNVCTVYDFGDTDQGVPFLAMELITGESLKETLDREQVLPLERAIHIAAQVGEALQAAHDAGIVHRDLKPANIMITGGRDGDVVKVVDFDIAKGPEDGEGSEVTRLGFVVGTPEYMSPEQLMAEKLDGRSDIYSLGLVLFRMLTGTLPFRAASTQELMVQRLTTRPLRLDEVVPGAHFPAGVQEALDGALARDVALRPSGAAEFGRALTAAMATRGAPSRPARAPASPSGELPPTRVYAPAAAVPGTPAASATPRRSRMPAIAGAAALVVVAGVSAAWWVSARTPAAADAGPTAAADAGPATAAPAPAQQADVPAAPAPSSPPNADVPVRTAEAVGARDHRATSKEIAPSPSTRAAQPAADPGAPPPPVRSASADPSPVTAVPQPEPGLAAADAAAALSRQFNLVGPPYPSRAVLSAIQDTAEGFYSLDGVASKQRALAAYIVANALVGLGKKDQVAAWLRRAVDLDPTARGYRTMLNQWSTNP